MKRYRRFVLLLITLLLSPIVIAMEGTAITEETGSENLLQQMVQATRSLSYQLAYINVTKQGIDSLRYSYAVIQQQPVAQLLQLDGPRREVILQNNQINYFEPGIESFSLKGEYIVDALPAIAFADIKRLGEYYSYIAMGRSRIADRSCDVIRVVSRDDMRFSYVVWVDEQSRLPLRVDLLDRDGETLEQFRVVTVTLGQGVDALLQPLLHSKSSPLLSLPEKEPVNFDWQVGWLPDGFKEVSHNLLNDPTEATLMESRLYSDGLFSFSISVTPKTSNGEQLLRQGRRTIHTESINKHTITLVGEIPSLTAKRIVSSVFFSETKPAPSSKE